MRLTTYTDYTLRTLMYLALDQRRQTTIAEIADAYGISQTHLMKVVHQLGVSGEVATTRGRRGGLRLNRDPASINIGSVVRRTEQDVVLVPCLSRPPSGCPIYAECVLRRIADEALAAFLAVLDRYTLADLVAPRQPLGRMLGLDLAGAAAD